MKALMLCALLILTGCVGSQEGQIVAPVSMSADISGEVDINSLMVAYMPLTYPIHAWGEGTITLQFPQQPHVLFEGDGGWIIEPITPQDAPRVEALIAAGVIRGGRYMPAGTIASMKATAIKKEN